jgi:hypothetical protein
VPATRFPRRICSGNKQKTSIIAFAIAEAAFCCYRFLSPRLYQIYGKIAEESTNPANKSSQRVLRVYAAFQGQRFDETYKLTHFPKNSGVWRLFTCPYSNRFASQSRGYAAVLMLRHFDRRPQDPAAPWSCPDDWLQSCIKTQTTGYTHF